MIVWQNSKPKNIFNVAAMYNETLYYFPNLLLQNILSYLGLQNNTTGPDCEATIIMSIVY